MENFYPRPFFSLNSHVLLKRCVKNSLMLFFARTSNKDIFWAASPLTPIVAQTSQVLQKALKPIKRSRLSLSYHKGALLINPRPKTTKARSLKPLYLIVGIVLIAPIAVQIKGAVVAALQIKEMLVKNSRGENDFQKIMPEGSRPTTAGSEGDNIDKENFDAFPDLSQEKISEERSNLNALPTDMSSESLLEAEALPKKRLSRKYVVNFEEAEATLTQKPLTGNEILEAIWCCKPQEDIRYQMRTRPVENLDFREPYFGFSLLFWAFKREYFAIALDLIQAGVNTQPESMEEYLFDDGTADNDGPLLFHAIIARDEKIVEFLLEHGLYWDQISKLTPLEFAKQYYKNQRGGYPIPVDEKKRSDRDNKELNILSQLEDFVWE